MSVAIEEVTAEVTPSEGRAQQPPPAEPQTTSPAQIRRQLEQYERMRQRAARLCAD
jgi:hypothetical protein